MGKLLRDQKEVALNDLLRDCLRAYEHYRLAMDVVEEKALVDTLAHMTHARDSLCRRIELFIREFGYLPDTLDPDRQTVRKLTKRAQAFLSGDEQKMMLNHAARLEDDLQARFEAVLDMHWPKRSALSLRQLQKESLSAKDRIDELRDKLRDSGKPQ
jgi:hypothetical protein